MSTLTLISEVEITWMLMPLSASVRNIFLTTRARSDFARVKEVGGAPILRHVLHDHVDIDGVVGERAEDRRRDAGAVGDAQQRDLGLVAAVGDTADDLLFHDFVLINDQRARRIG